MILILIALIAIIVAVAIIWKRPLAQSSFIKALLNLGGLLVLFLIILTFGVYLRDKWQATFDVFVEKALWFQFIPSKLGDNDQVVIDKQTLDRDGIYSCIYLELRIENRKEYVASIIDMQIDTLYSAGYHSLRPRYESYISYQLVDSLGYPRFFHIPKHKERFFWDLSWWDSIDLSLFQPKEERPIYAIFEFQTDSFLDSLGGKFRGEFYLVDMGVKKIKQEFEAVPGAGVVGN